MSDEVAAARAAVTPGAAVSAAERGLLDAVSREALWETLEFLNTVDRTSGTEGEFAAVDYLVEKLRAWGVPVEVHEFQAYLSYPVKAWLRVWPPEDGPAAGGPAGPSAGGPAGGGMAHAAGAPRPGRAWEGVEIPCKTRAFSASTPPQGIEGELVYVKVERAGIGLDDEGNAPADRDFAGLDVRGKVVLTDRGGPAAVEAAQQAGAAAHIHVWPSGEDAIHEMIATPVWGTPTPASAPSVPAIPALSVKQADGERLKAWCEAAAAAGRPLRVRLGARSDTGWRRQRLPVATIPGTEEPDQFVLVAGHLDAWYVGITDNGTGNAACLELCRVLWQHRDRLRRTVKVAWWPGHSTGRYAGSTWYADHFWQELHDGCITYVNVDSPGARGATRYDPTCYMAENEPFAREVIAAVTGQTGWEREWAVRAGDQSFWGPGVPSLFMLLSSRPRDEWYAVGGCGMNWWWHTEYDGLETADPDILVTDTQIYLLATWRLANADVYPLDVAASAREVRKFITEYRGALAAGAWGEAAYGLDLGPLAGAADRLVERAEALMARIAALHDAGPAAAGSAPLDPGRARALNRCLLGVSRALVPVVYTRSGPFEHDPATPVPPLPGLEPLRRLARLDPASDAARFLATALVREANRVGYALRQALSFVEHGLLAVAG